MDYQPNPAAGIYSQTSVLMAIFSLAKVLEESGAIEKGRYAKSLRGTAMQPGADANRPDYHFLVLLADALDSASQPEAGVQ